MPKDPGQLFNDKPNRHYRRAYSTTEPKIGAVVVLGLCAVLGWVVWMGANPDPTLFEANLSLVYRGPEGPGRQSADRGPLPAQLDVPGFREGELSSFDATNLYVKINGREGFYKSFGFERLIFLSLVDDSDPTRVIDIETYDLGRPENAAACFAAETPEGAHVDVVGGTRARRDRNALYLAQGQLYVRAIASDESERATAGLAALRELLIAALPKAETNQALPELLVAAGAAPDAVRFLAENALGFAFGKEVHTATVLDGETDIFVVAAPSPADAAALAAQFMTGFAELGEETRSGKIVLVKDRYLERLSGAQAVGGVVVGVAGAADAPTAAGLLTALADAAGSARVEPGPSAPAAPADAETPAGGGADRYAEPSDEQPEDDEQAPVER